MKISSRFKTAVLVLVVNLVACEFIAGAFFKIRQMQYLPSDVSAYTLSIEQIEKLKNNFDPLLGWKISDSGLYGERPSSIASKRPKAPPNAFLQAYGDSFTYGMFMQNDEAWTSLVEKIVASPVLNFGVPAFGSDQAILFYQDNIRKLPPPKFVSLGFIDGALIRNMTNYRNIQRYVAVDYMLTKPRFELENEALVLVANPIQSVNELYRLSENQFVSNLVRKDWFFNNYKIADFPFLSLFFSRGGDDLVRNSYTMSQATYLATKVNFKHQIKLFRKIACKNGSEPIIIRYATYEMLEQGTESFGFFEGDDMFDEFCKDLKIKCYFPREEFMKKSNFESLFLNEPGHHLNAEGNALFAKGFSKFLMNVQNEPSACD